MQKDPIENPPNKLYDPRRYDVGHWADEEVYVYREIVDNPEGELVKERYLRDYLDGYYSPDAPWFTQEAALNVETNNNGNAFLVVYNRSEYAKGNEVPLFVTPDMKAIRYLATLPSMTPAIGEDTDMSSFGNEPYDLDDRDTY